MNELTKHIFNILEITCFDDIEIRCIEKKQYRNILGQLIETYYLKNNYKITMADSKYFHFSHGKRLIQSGIVQYLKEDLKTIIFSKLG